MNVLKTKTQHKQSNMNKELLNKMISEKMVGVQKHPFCDLYIYNYTKQCTFSHTWNEVTMQCRGLILDGDMNIVARPMRKFFNYEELDKNNIPDLPFKAYDKIDGSMGILYWAGDMPSIATRRSFISEQAAHATEIYRERYINVPIDRSKTYIFEIVYPKDAKIVKYGDLDDLILLAIIDNETGEEDDIKTMSEWFKTPKEYDAADYNTLRDKFAGDNREGFVVKFSNNFRMKMKYKDYLKSFKEKYYITDKIILNALIDRKMDDIYNLAKNADEEIRIYIDDTVNKFLDEYDAILCAAVKIFIRKEFSSRKEAAAYFLKFKELSCILFIMYDNKNPEQAIWNMMRKKYNHH